MFYYLLILHLAIVFFSLRLSFVFLTTGKKTGNTTFFVIGYAFTVYPVLMIGDYIFTDLPKVEFLENIEFPTLIIALTIIGINFMLRPKWKKRLNYSQRNYADEGKAA